VVRKRKREYLGVFENGVLIKSRRVRWVGNVAENKRIQNFGRKA
jgi:hypothetical protein